MGDDQQNQSNPPTLSGNVHPRDVDSSPSPRRTRNDGTDVSTYEHPQVLAFAARNRRGRFYIPSRHNEFGGVHVDHVLFDSGCSSILLPFPVASGFPDELLKQVRYQWIVSSSRGTGAVHSPVLKIRMILGGFACTLGGRGQQIQLPLLRFHVGSLAANTLLNTERYRAMLDDNCVGKLNNFLRQVGRNHVVSPERTYALLGQSYLSRVMYCQKGDVGLVLSNDFGGGENIVDIMRRYHQKLVPLVNAFEGFHDLEDDDGDEDEDNYRLSWEQDSSDDEIEEPDYR
mmetsp:Transcript_40331/g.97342  ORF Transcript_40331/g.97342 Transcript_40331/m.97342 type:complete len:286 (+) Transcript_40331:61-918(+)